MDTKTLTAEFVGTFALVFIGAGAAAVNAVGVLGVALAFGLVLMAVVAAYGPVSGAHVNPAVTIALWAARQIKPAQALRYIGVQLLGGIAAGLALSLVLPARLAAQKSLGATLLAQGVTPAQGLVIEAVLTFFLVSTVFHMVVSGKGGGLTPVAIGAALGFSVLMGAPLTGASLNPARSIGPAIAAGEYSDLWVYLAGPVLGGLGAMVLHRNVMEPPRPREKG